MEIELRRESYINVYNLYTDSNTWGIMNTGSPYTLLNQAATSFIATRCPGCLGCYTPSNIWRFSGSFILCLRVLLYFLQRIRRCFELFGRRSSSRECSRPAELFLLRWYARLYMILWMTLLLHPPTASEDIRPNVALPQMLMRSLRQQSTNVRMDLFQTWAKERRHADPRLLVKVVQ